MATGRKGEASVDLRFAVRRDAGAAARRALLALGGNGTLRAFNKAWSHSPTREAQEALDLVAGWSTSCPLLSPASAPHGSAKVTDLLTALGARLGS